MPPYHGSCPPAGFRSSLAGLTSRQSAGDSSPGPAATPASVQQQQPTITFEYHEGSAVKRVPLDPKIAESIGDSPNYELATTVAEPDDFGEFPSLVTLVRKESRRLEKTAIVLGDREKKRDLRYGNHFGGYRPGKNARQTPSPRQSPSLFGLPAETLASIDGYLNEIRRGQRLASEAVQQVITQPISSGSYNF